MALSLGALDERFDVVIDAVVAAFEAEQERLGPGP